MGRGAIGSGAILAAEQPPPSHEDLVEEGVAEELVGRQADRISPMVEDDSSTHLQQGQIELVRHMT